MPDATAGVRRFRSLSAKFLMLTVVFVMLIEVLILVPSVANYRMTWLTGRLDQARAASGIFDSALRGDPMLQRGLLMALDAESVTIREPGMVETIKEPGPLREPSVTVSEADFSPLGSIGGAFAELVDGGDQSIRVVGAPDRDGRTLEVVVRDDELRAGMLVYMRNIILISLLIAIFTALLVFAAARALLIRPIQRMNWAMAEFATAPDDSSLVIQPDARSDELGVAQRQLANMQRQVGVTLHQQKRLAELGLAVSKINHDMRNILASAQLVSDRLSDVDDPVVQRVAPRLIRALDRAVTYSEGVLEYGRTTEAHPRLEMVPFDGLARDIRELALPDGDDAIQVEIDAPDGFELHVDREQMLRVLLNLVRNALQAIRGSGVGGRITLRGSRAEGGTMVQIVDDGPGLPIGQANTLFAPFGSSTSRGGTGLGLAIARELVEAHRGTIAAEPNEPSGTRFVIRLPVNDEGASGR